MDEEQQDDIPPRMVELDEIQQQAQAAREQPAAEPALADAPKDGVVGTPLIEVTDDPPEGAVDVQFNLPDDTEEQDQKFTEIVQDVGQQAAVAQAAVPDPAAPAQQNVAQPPQAKPKAAEVEQFVQPERNPGERYIAFRNRSREARKEFANKQWHKELDAIKAAEQNPVPIDQLNQQAKAAQAADPPAQVQAPLVPAAEIAQQAQAAREVDAPPGNVARGAGAAAAAPGGRVALDLEPQDLERLTREGEDTAEQLVERFRAFIEQTRTFNRSLLSMLDSVTAAMAQDHALLEQIRSRFERTREG